MINNIHIENYKCIVVEDVQIKPLTIITGLNSTGKSTLAQSILLPDLCQLSNNVSNVSTSYDTIVSKNSRENKDVVIRIDFDDNTKREVRVSAQTNDNNKKCQPKIKGPSTKIKGPSIFNDKGLYYLSVNSTISDFEKIALRRTLVDFEGNYIFNTFNAEKNNPVLQPIVNNNRSNTLQSQLNYWLSYIFDQSLEVTTTMNPTDGSVEIEYNSDGIKNIKPTNLGRGVTYLAKVLIICLRAKKGNVVIVEHPEIHLHPSAQAKLGEFLAFVAAAGTQLIVETHCEHLITSVQYAVYCHKINHSDVTILYKSSIKNPFVSILLEKNGEFGESFPEGFFDATLKELMEMNV